MAHQNNWNITGYNLAKSELRSRMIHSPDIAKLSEYEEHIVFIYDGFKSTLNDHKFFLKNAKFLGKAITVKDSYHLKRTANYPLLFDLGGDESSNYVRGRKKVLGEAYAVDLEEMLKLDALYANNLIFERQKLCIKLMDQTAPMKNSYIRPTVDSWVYFGNEGHWKDHPLNFASMKIDSGISTWTWDPRESMVIH